MIDELLPEAASVAESFGDLPGPEPYGSYDPCELFPEEQAIVGNSVDKRQREFAVGRGCARRALAGLGLPPVPVLSGQRGEPRWPRGVVGAITHCDGYSAAVVARRGEVLALGVDAEPASPLPAGILEAVSLPEERIGLRHRRTHAPHVPWDRLLFSAKESVYKAWYPLTGRRLEFEDASIMFDPARGTFAARLLVPGWPVGEGVLTGFSGRFLLRAGLVLTSVAVPVPVADRRPVAGVPGITSLVRSAARGRPAAEPVRAAR